MKEYESRSNSFSLTFGKKPMEYIIRYENINGSIFQGIGRKEGMDMLN